MLAYSMMIELLRPFSDALTVFFLSMLPITELQGGIAYGLTILDMSPFSALVAGIAGCTTSALLLVLFLEPATNFLQSRSKLADRFFTWLFARTRAKYSESMSRLGHFALFTYIVIPTPGSGAWTGALIAHLFGISAKKALPILGLGLAGTGFIVVFGVESLLYLFRTEAESAPRTYETLNVEERAQWDPLLAPLLETGILFTQNEQVLTLSAQTKDFLFVEEEGKLKLELAAPFNSYLVKTLQKEWESPSTDLTLLSADPDQISKAITVGTVTDGWSIQESQLRALLFKSIREQDFDIEVPRHKVHGKIINATGLDLGPLEEIGEGKSTFWGSSPEREFNIEKALNEKFNGILIPPGAEFSYVEWLGPIEWGGWKQAYTIFNGTQLEKAPAGGVCQVSTTVYRAVLDAALEITEHRTHSLYVIYYNEYGDGLDATVFPGEQDFKFVNNTENYLLMTATEEGYYEAVIRFYGEDDGRETTLIGPYTTSNPTEESTAAVGDLGIGEMAWKYLITHADGTESVEWIRSTYLSKATQYKVEPSELDTDALPIKTGP